MGRLHAEMQDLRRDAGSEADLASDLGNWPSAEEMGRLHAEMQDLAR